MFLWRNNLKYKYILVESELWTRDFFFFFFFFLYQNALVDLSVKICATYISAQPY